MRASDEQASQNLPDIFYADPPADRIAASGLAIVMPQLVNGSAAIPEE
jgi:hypothetical protein